MIKQSFHSEPSATILKSDLSENFTGLVCKDQTGELLINNP